MTIIAFYIFGCPFVSLDMLTLYKRFLGLASDKDSIVKDSHSINIEGRLSEQLDAYKFTGAAKLKRQKTMHLIPNLKYIFCERNDYQYCGLLDRLEFSGMFVYI